MKRQPLLRLDICEECHEEKIIARSGGNTCNDCNFAQQVYAPEMYADSVEDEDNETEE